jgi:hypothetical protein
MSWSSDRYRKLIEKKILTFCKEYHEQDFLISTFAGFAVVWYPKLFEFWSPREIVSRAVWNLVDQGKLKFNENRRFQLPD